MIFLGYFPVCYIEGSGLTPFKIISEYVISAGLLVSTVLLYRKKNQLNPYIFKMVVLFIAFSILSEIAFTFYISVYGVSNLIGHIAKIFAYYFLGAALLETGIRTPFSILSQDLKDANEELRWEREHLRAAVEEKQQPCSSAWQKLNN